MAPPSPPAPPSRRRRSRRRMPRGAHRDVVAPPHVPRSPIPARAIRRSADRPPSPATKASRSDLRHERARRRWRAARSRGPRDVMLAASDYQYAERELRRRARRGPDLDGPETPRGCATARRTPSPARVARIAGAAHQRRWDPTHMERGAPRNDRRRSGPRGPEHRDDALTGTRRDQLRGSSARGCAVPGRCEQCGREPARGGGGINGGSSQFNTRCTDRGERRATGSDGTNEHATRAEGRCEARDG